MALPKLLIVDDDEAYVNSLRRALQGEYRVTAASNADEARRAVASGCDIALLDVRLDDSDMADRSGLELLADLRSSHPDVPALVMTAFGDVRVAVQAMKLGATDFLEKPFELAKLRATLAAALEREYLRDRISSLQDDIDRIEPTEMVGQSSGMRDVRRMVQMVAQDGYANVLVEGETGTGKELVARAIHRIGRRASEPFVAVAIPALNPAVVESELFGHEAGAFTGAKGRRIGFIEKARRGVLFLDEIGDLSAEAQLKLLRFIEARTFARVGSSDELESEVQIVTATNRDLQAAVRSRAFREDLYFRLKGMQIHMPSLRTRQDDIPLLAEHLLGRFAQQGRTAITEVDPEAQECLVRYEWPGNVRELKAVLERAIIYANYNGHYRVLLEDLPVEIRQPSSRTTSKVSLSIDGPALDLDNELARTELAYIEEALRLTEDRKNEAWKLLRLNDRFALLRRIKRLIRDRPELTKDFARVRKLYAGDVPEAGHDDVPAVR